MSADRVVDRVLVFDFELPTGPVDGCERCGWTSDPDAVGVYEKDLWEAAMIWPGLYPTDGFPLRPGALLDIEPGQLELPDPDMVLDLEYDQVGFVILCGGCLRQYQLAGSDFPPGLPCVELYFVNHQPMAA